MPFTPSFLAWMTPTKVLGLSLEMTSTRKPSLICQAALIVPFLNCQSTLYMHHTIYYPTTVYLFYLSPLMDHESLIVETLAHSTFFPIT